MPQVGECAGEEVALVRCVRHLEDPAGQEVLVELVRVETRSVERADCLSSLGL
jgi:hypothetical protein